MSLLDVICLGIKKVYNVFAKVHITRRFINTVAQREKNCNYTLPHDSHINHFFPKNITSPSLSILEQTVLFFVCFFSIKLMNYGESRHISEHPMHM